MTLVMQRESTEYIYIGVLGAQPSVGGECAFLAAGIRPLSGDWKTALIVNNVHALWSDALASGATGDYYVAIKIGAFSGGTVILSPGDYQVWVRLTDTSEQPVRIAAEALEIA